MNASRTPALATGVAPPSDPAQASARFDLITARPYIGLVGVLLGATMSTLGSRATTFGLADLRGGLHAGFDEGAWITTSFGVGQMLIGVASPYLGAVFGVTVVTVLLLVALNVPWPRGVSEAAAESRVAQPTMAKAAKACSAGARFIPGSRWLHQRFSAAERRAERLSRPS